MSDAVDQPLHVSSAVNEVMLSSSYGLAVDCGFVQFRHHIYHLFGDLSLLGQELNSTLTWMSQIVRDSGLTAADAWAVADDRSTWRAL